jgi:hypothetical protein
MSFRMTLNFAFVKIFIGVLLDFKIRYPKNIYFNNLGNRKEKEDRFIIYYKTLFDDFIEKSK